ncbi:hypothetical protein [Streptomyces yangpuensis]|uniref:hypothetical protein n=1 Tax=Streptomyces yangpuensis TaxID=1648182 RepID=UPI0036600344|nr:hypothetical protein [Streptomyces erythrochromogenes]
MSNDAVFRESVAILIDRSVFGVDEDRSSGEAADRPFWVDLPMDREAPVSVGLNTICITSLVGSHEAQVTIEVYQEQNPADVQGFESLGSWGYRSVSGKASVFNLDGPVLQFPLAPDTEYLLCVWRKGGESAVERHAALLGARSPIAGLEEYVIQFHAAGATGD